MQTFKSVLKQALKLQASRIAIQVGRVVKLTDPQGQAIPAEMPMAEDGWLTTLFGQLLPKDQTKILNGQPVRGALQIPGVGQLFLVAKSSEPRSLHVFLPPDQEANSIGFLESLNITQGSSEEPDLSRFEPAVAAQPFQPSSPSLPFEQASLPPEVEESLPAAQELPQSGTIEGEQSFALNAVAAPDAVGSSQPTQVVESPGTPTPAEDLSGDSAPSLDDMFASHGKGSDLAVEPSIESPPPALSFDQASELDDPFPADSVAQTPDLGDGSAPAADMPVDFASTPYQDGTALTGGGEEFGNFSSEDLTTPLDSPLALDSPVPAPRFESAAPVSPSQPAPELAHNFAASSPLPMEGERVASPRTDRVEPAGTIDFSDQVPGSISISDGTNPIDPILKDMVGRSASDLHLTISQPIIYRVDGDITRTDGAPLDSKTMQSYLEPIMPLEKRAVFGERWDVDFAYEVGGVGRFRVNMFRDNYGIGSVMRHIPDQVLTADQLGLPDIVRRFCTLSKGLVLVTGPTGSGKSTTLAAMIDLINQSRFEHILTIEDPIEFVHQQKSCLINQREVGKHTGSFAAALKAALREDPDIVLVGELRDLETTAIALETAETGHLVFGTLHTNTAVSTVDRIIDQFPADQQRIIRNMLASSLKGVVSQTLCKKVGGGRCAVHEILVPNDAVASMIRESKLHMIPNHMQTSVQEGNVLLNDALIALVQQGQVDGAEAWRKAIDKKDFEETAKRKNVAITV